MYKFINKDICKISSLLKIIESFPLTISLVSVNKDTKKIRSLSKVHCNWWTDTCLKSPIKVYNLNNVHAHCSKFWFWSMGRESRATSLVVSLLCTVYEYHKPWCLRYKVSILDFDFDLQRSSLIGYFPLSKFSKY